MTDISSQRSIYWPEARVLVTGGTGMIGSNLVRRLVDSGCHPFLMMRAPNRTNRISDLDGRFTPLAVDITDAASVAAAVAAAQPEIVFHLASSFFNPPTLAPGDHMRINSMGMLNLCEPLKDFPDARLVYAGSCAVYPGGTLLPETAPLNPGSMFGASKAAGSLIAHAAGRISGFHTIELRLFAPFGPYENARRIIPDTILSAMAGREVQIGHGGQQRDFVYMDDVIDAFFLAVTRPLPSGLTVNIASGLGRPIRDVVARVLDLMDNPVSFRTGTRPPRPDEIWEMSGDISVAETTLGWRPRVDFDEGLRRTIRWFQDNRSLAPILQ